MKSSCEKNYESKRVDSKIRFLSRWSRLLKNISVSDIGTERRYQLPQKKVVIELKEDARMRIYGSQ